VEVIPAMTGMDWANRSYPQPVNQALLQCWITALRTTIAIAILIEAPGTVLRLFNVQAG
jgi:hypothetical protein